MSRNLIIAVGGSGQTVVSHYLRYATMAGIAGNELPHIYILDADLKESVRESETKPSLFGEIEKLHKRLVAGLSESNKPWLKLLYPYGSDTPLASQQTFAEYLIGNRLGDKEKDRKPVLDGLFGKPEQELMIAEGFFARPNVGATAIFDKLYSELKDDVLDVIKREIAHPNPPRVVVIGSTFGGTGSGGAPVIAQQLRRWAGENSPIKIGVFLTLPWFSPGDLGKTTHESRDTQGKWETQIKNTAAGLRFYGTSPVFLEKVDVFLADYNGDKHARFDDSNTGQPEYPHCFNLILAAQVQNYLIRTASPDEKPGQYGLYFLADQRSPKKFRLDGQDAALLRFSAGALRQDLAEWSKQTQTLRLTLRKIADFINQDFRLQDAGVRDRPQKFLDLAMALANTCTYMPDRIIDTGFFLKKSKDANPKVYGRFAQALNERAEQLGAVIGWLREAWEQSDKNPDLVAACLADDPLQIWNHYLALNQRNAEVSAIQVFNKAFETAGAVVEDFQSRIGNAQQEPFHAAAELVEKLLRQAIIDLGGSGDRLGDELAPNIRHDQTAVALLPVQVTAAPSDHCKLPVRLQQILDNGTSREGRHIHVFDEAHPATLVGVTHYNVPSPWAAAHLNAWILSCGYDPAGNPPALWRESRDSLAAILWAIFTKRLQVSTIPYKQLARLGRILSGSLKAELLGYRDADQTLDRVVYASDAQGRTIAVNHPVCGWFPAPGLLEDDGVGWWKANGYDLPTEIPLAGADSLEASQMQAFIDVLDDLMRKTGQEDSRDPAGWYWAIGSLAQELHSRIPRGARAEPVVATENFFVLLDKEDRALFQVPVKVLAQSGEDLIAKFCVSEVAVVSQPNGFRAADLPFRSEFLGRDDLSAELQNIINGADGKPKAVRYRLTLKDRGSFYVERPAWAIDYFDIHTEIWPNFKMEGWQLYFLGSVLGDTRAAGDYSFSLFSQEGKLIGEANRKFTQNDELQGVPEYLVFESPIKKCEAGVFLVGLYQSVSTSEKHFRLALDFGTSHSCVYATDNNGVRIPLDFSAPADRLGKAIFDKPGLKSDLLSDNTTFLPSYSSQPQKSDTSVLPSALKLLGQFTRKHLGSGIKSFVMIPMRFKSQALENLVKARSRMILDGYKWSGGLKGSDFEHQERGLTAEYLRQVLRIAAAILRNGGYLNLSMFRATFPEAFSFEQRRIYTDVVAETLAAVLRETGIAFENGGQPLETEQLLEIASPSLAEQRNSQLNEDSSGMVSESIAALLSARNDYNVFADRGVCLVLDMGGGTTDVAAYVSKGREKDEAEATLSSITDSIRYAGHDLLRLLATPQVLKDILTDAGKEEDQSEDDRVSTLKILVRDEGYFKQLKHNFSVESYLPETKEQMLLFFEGLFEYTRLLILAYRKAMQAQDNNQPWVVNIALFGNAWKLAELVYPSQEKEFDGFKKNFQKYLKYSFPNETINIHYRNATQSSIKEATASGALKLNPRTPQFSTPKQHASLAGFKVQCHKSDGTDIEVGADDFLDGFDLEVFDRDKPLTVKTLASLRPQPFLEKLRAQYNRDDDVWIADQVGDVIDQAIRVQWTQPGKRYTMKFSPMRLFLENIWKETIRVVPLNPVGKGKK